MAKQPLDNMSVREPELTEGGGMIDFFRRAPALRYALALGAITAVLAIFVAALDWRVAVFGALFVLVAMVILIVISRLAEDRNVNLRNAMYLFVYSSEIILIITIVFFMVTFFVLPETLHKFGLRSFYEWTGIGPSTAVLRRNARQYVTEFNDAIGGAATPSAVAEAIERVESFWRQPEQRDILRKYRCGDPGSESIFDQSAKYVLDNKDLMKDIDTKTRYYDLVARCAIVGDCVVGELCRFFYSNMEDVQRQFSEYFRELGIIEGRNPIDNVRMFLFKNCPRQDSLSPVTKRAVKCN